MDLTLLSLDDLQTILHRIDHHQRTVREQHLKREDVVDEMNKRVDMTTSVSHSTVWIGADGKEHEKLHHARRAYFK